MSAYLSTQKSWVAGHVNTGQTDKEYISLLA